MPVATSQDKLESLNAQVCAWWITTSDIAHSLKDKTLTLGLYKSKKAIRAGRAEKKLVIKDVINFSALDPEGAGFCVIKKLYSDPKTSALTIEGHTPLRVEVYGNRMDIDLEKKQAVGPSTLKNLCATSLVVLLISIIILLFLLLSGCSSPEPSKTTPDKSFSNHSFLCE